MSKKVIAKAFQSKPLYKEMLTELLKLQPRFSAEPILARTGKGYLKSKGVAELQKTKHSLAEKNYSQKL